MAANAIITSGTKLEIKQGTGTGAYTEVKGFKSFSGLGGGSAQVIDCTDLGSAAKEKKIGLPDEGQLQIGLVYLPSDPGQKLLATARTSQAVVSFQITLSDTTTKFTGAAYVLSFEKSGDADAIVDGSATLEITGAVTVASS